MECVVINSQEIFTVLKKMLIEDFEVEEDLIVPEASFYSDLGLDSLDAIDLVILLSNNYDVNIDNKSIEKAQTIKQLVDMIKVHIDK